VFKICALCRWCADKCKNPDNPNCDSFRHEGAVCSVKKANSGNSEHTIKDWMLRRALKVSG